MFHYSIMMNLNKRSWMVTGTRPSTCSMGNHLLRKHQSGNLTNSLFYHIYGHCAVSGVLCCVVGWVASHGADMQITDDTPMISCNTDAQTAVTKHYFLSVLYLFFNRHTYFVIFRLKNMHACIYRSVQHQTGHHNGRLGGWHVRISIVQFVLLCFGCPLAEAKPFGNVLCIVRQFIIFLSFSVFCFS